MKCDVSPAANLISKPLETAGRKAMGAKVLLVLRQPGRRKLCIRISKERIEDSNMSKKKILKSIAAAGIAFGGAGVMQDMDVVYAAELDTTKILGDEDEVVIQLESPNESSAGSENISQITEQPSEDISASEDSQSAVEDEAASVETSESASADASTSEGAETSESENASTSETSEQESETSENQYIDHSEDISTSEA